MLTALVDRRGFLKGIKGLACILAASELKSLEAFAFRHSSQDDSKIEISSLVKSIKSDIESSSLNNLVWINGDYEMHDNWIVEATDNSSESAVVLLPVDHYMLCEGRYNQMIGILSKYVSSFGYEGIEYDEKDVIQSRFEKSKKERNWSSIDQLYKHYQELDYINKHKTKVFGLEDREVCKTHNCLWDLLDFAERQTRLSQKNSALDEKYLLAAVKEYYSNLRHVQGLPDFDIKLIKEPESHESKTYFASLKRLERLYSMGAKVVKWVENVSAVIAENYAFGVHPNIVGMIYGHGHTTLTKGLLDEIRISHVTINYQPIEKSVLSSDATEPENKK